MEDIMQKKEKGSKGSTSYKIRKLQKQYNKILVDLFDKYAAESIEEALEECEGSFGENISSIVQNALDSLRGKVISELGIADHSEEGADGVDTIAGIISNVPKEVMDIEIGNEGDTIENEESEESEEDTEESEEDAETEDGEEDDSDDESDDDKADSDEDKTVKESVSLLDAYAQVYKK